MLHRTERHEMGKKARGTMISEPKNLHLQLALFMLLYLGNLQFIERNSVKIKKIRNSFPDIWSAMGRLPIWRARERAPATCAPNCRRVPDHPPPSTRPAAA
jgi:hypothetical protein